MTWTLRELTPERWDDFESLFASANGVCGGCWCMFWRLEPGEKFGDIKGAKARRRMKKLVESGKALGLLAYDGDEPVGWLSYGPRRDYPKLDRAPSFKVEDADRVWSLPCFFVKTGYRGRGVARELLAEALRSLGQRGAEIAEAYPVITFTATGGSFTQPYTWSAVNLPPGLTLSSGGTLSGVPTQPGTFDFILKLTDYLGRSVQWNYTITIR